ncbi:hypothetical protein BBP40_005933 [Aspergillus hancockii]|nr:hypothetical protein BBP40_005933 [Aspergillus hancockii]
MDAGRISALKAVRGKLGAFSARETICLIELFDKDAGRTSALEILQGKLGAFSAKEAICLIELFDTDAGRTSALEILQGAFSADEAIHFAEQFDMDSGRTSARETVQRNLGRLTSNINTPRALVVDKGVWSKVGTDIHYKNLTFGPDEYQVTISERGSYSVLGSLPESGISQIMLRAKQEASQARRIREAFGPGKRLSQERSDPTYGISFNNIMGGVDVQLYILAVHSLLYTTENIHVGSGCTQFIATVSGFNGQREAKRFLEHINWTEYELIARPSSSFGDIILEEEDAMMIWSAKPISLGGISAKDRSRLYILQTTPEDAQSILDLMPPTYEPDDCSRCWVILRKGTKTGLSSLSR